MIVERRLSDGAVTIQDRIGREVDFRVEEFFDQRTESIRLGQARQDVAKFKVS